MNGCLEEKIAKLQKNKKLLAKIDELQQEPDEQEERILIPDQFMYEEKSLFDGKVQLPIIKDLVIENYPTKNIAIFSKIKGLSFLVGLKEDVNKKVHLKDHKEDLADYQKKKHFYMEICKLEERENNEKVIHIAELKIPVIIGTVAVMHYIVYQNNKCLWIVAASPEKYLDKFKEPINYMLEHLKWEGEKVCIH